MRLRTTLCGIGLISVFLAVLNLVGGCTEDDSDPTPTPTPTITPTPTPTGNAPELLFPIDDEQVTGESITFDWTDALEANRYWLAMWFWYVQGEGGTWVPLWENNYQESELSQQTLSRSDIWFYWQDLDYGWQPGRYAWTVQGDTSSVWAETGFFIWLE
ncbi:hypothetical protein JXQ70_07840 [bacterium]|nr:hypothetical protein [bacterium]